MSPEAYLARIGLDSREGPSAAWLGRLHGAHLLTVPFENLDIHRGVPIVLEVPSLLAKIVERRRGGFCYELNGVFAWLLSELGFSVTLMAAEVWGQDGFGIPFDHLVLRVDLERPMLVDVGFGEGFRFPLVHAPDECSRQLDHDYRIVERDGWQVLERRGPDADFVPQYRFSTVARELGDFSGGCLHHQSSPSSPFTRGPMCSLALPQGRVTVRRDRVIQTLAGERSEHPIHDDAGWREALREHCGVELAGE